MESIKTCSVDGCEKPHFGRSWCQMHYARWRIAGDIFHERKTKDPNRRCSIDGCHGKYDCCGYCTKHYKRLFFHGDPLYEPAHDKPPCPVEGCDLEAKARGFCNSHYMKWFRYGDPLHITVSRRQRCSIDGCEEYVVGRGWCNMHYSRWQMHGDPLTILNTPRLKVPDGWDEEVSGRICLYCHEPKPLTDFHMRSIKDGTRRSVCKECAIDHTGKWFNSDVDGTTRRDIYRERKFGMKPGTYDRMKAEQGGKCYICRRPEALCPKGVLCVDHDHATNEVRGLLCGNCNSMLGHARDDPSVLAAAIDYLHEFGGQAAQSLSACNASSLMDTG